MPGTHFASLLHYDVKDMKHLFVSTAIRIFGGGMVSLFVPLIIYSMGSYPVLGLQYVFLFFAFASLCVVCITIFVSVPLIHRWGTKVGMILGIFSLLFYQNMFIFFEGSHLLLYIAPLLLSLFGAFFWPAFHFNIAHTQKTQRFGSQIAKLNIIITIMLALGPLLGGYMLDFWGIVPTVIVANVFVFASLFPLLLSSQPHKDNFVHQGFMVTKEILAYLYAQRKNVLTKAFATKGYIEFVTILWPLLVFILYKKFSTVGLIVTIATVFSVLLIYFLGKLMDTHKEQFIMKYVLRMQIFVWIFGFIIVVFNVLNGFVLSFIDMANRFTKGLSKTCIEKKMYDTSRVGGANFMSIMIYEVSIHGFRVVSCLLFLAINYFFGVTIAIAFMLLLLVFVLPWQYGIFKK